MTIKSYSRYFSALAALAFSIAVASATSFTATTSGNWTLGATWGNSGNNVVGSGVPGAADDADVPSGITVGVNAVSAVNNITVESGGALSINANSAAAFTINGNVVNNGTWALTGAGNSTETKYASASGTISGSGTVSNQIATFTGSYTIQPGAAFVAGVKNTGIAHLLGGTGSLVNQGTLIYNSGDQALTSPDIASLDSSAVGSTFILKWSNVAGSHNTVRAGTYYNFVYDSNNGTGCNLSGCTVNGDLTFDTALSANGAGAAGWPVNNLTGNLIVNSGGSSTAFPAGYSINRLTQSAGTLVVGAGNTLTVTGAGATAWNRTGGTFTANTGSTVEFSGGNPTIGTTAANHFANLTIDSSASNAVASSTLTVNNALTVPAGASLDMSANGHQLATAEMVLNAGTIAGAITSAAGSHAGIYGGNDGTIGTCTINGSVTLGGSNSFNLDIDSTAAAPHDQVIINGALSLNNSLISVKAPASIDTVNDYVLVTASGGIFGTPVLNWVVPPSDPNDYGVVVEGNSIKLRFGAGTGNNTAPVLHISRSGSDISLTWDKTAFPGYHLQSQTDASGINGGTWGDLSAADATPYGFTVDTSTTPTFYRLVK